VLITRPGTFTGTQTSGIENIRNAWAGRFSVLTGGKGSIADVAPSLTIPTSSPSNGETITRPDVTVKGAIINSTGNETGVTVNGIAATVYGNQFIANHVPLVDGANTITITATDTAGNTATTSITVTAVTTGNYIRLTSNIESGITPLEVTLRIDGSFSITNSTLNITGPVQPEIISSSSEEYTVKMTIEGIYTFTATATGPDGLTYQDMVVINVINKAQLDNMLRAKWEGMKTALAAGDINAAVANFADNTQAVYREQFTALQPIITQIAGELNAVPMAMVSAARRVVEYELVITREGNPFSFNLKFIQDDDGLWKIWSY